MKGGFAITPGCNFSVLKIFSMKISALKKTAILPLFFLVTIHSNAQKSSGFNIPEDFGKNGSAVLISVITASDKAKESIEETFQEEYKGKSELLNKAFDKLKPAEKEKYQYIFTVESNYVAARTIGNERYPATTDYKFGIIDVKTGKKYMQDFWSGSYKKGAKKYAEALEEKRKKNAGE